MSEQFTLVQTLTSPVPGSTVGGVNIGDGFGAAVSVDGDNLIVSIQNATIDSVSNAGAIGFYEKGGSYTQSQAIFSEKLSGDVPGAYNTLKIKDNWAMCTVGTSVAGGPGPSQHPGGAVLVFKLQQEKWKLVQTLLPNDPPTYTYDSVEYGIEFGGQFPDQDGEWAFIGSPQNMVNGVPLAGNVYVYQLQQGKQWVLTQKIQNPTGPTFNQAFGGACFINGNYAFISAEGNYTQFGSYPPDNGYAYFYQLNCSNNQWEFVQLLRGTSPPPPSPDGLGDLFGFRIQFNDDWAIIGAPLDSTNSSGVLAGGAVYYYKACNNGVTNWQLVTKVYPQNLYIQGAYGTNLFLEGNNVFITNNGTVNSLKHAGLLEVYELENNFWSYVTSINNPNPHQLDFFGSNMSATRNQLVVGMNPNFAYYLPYIDVPTPASFNNGSVYVYDY